jgi:hypothetical protein
VPHSSQNLTPSRFSVWHSGHFIFPTLHIVAYAPFTRNRGLDKDKPLKRPSEATILYHRRIFFIRISPGEGIFI